MENNWISVKERLPEMLKGEDNSKPVLAICGGKLCVMAYCFIEADENSGCSWCNCYGNIDGDPEFDDEYNVTHWQPLPLPPTSNP